MRGLDYTDDISPCWKIGANNWISLALLVVCYVGLGFMTFRSLRRLSASAAVVTLKKFDAVAEGILHLPSLSHRVLVRSFSKVLQFDLVGESAEGPRRRPI